MITSNQLTGRKGQRKIAREGQRLEDIVANSLNIMAEVHGNRTHLTGY